MSPCNAKWFKWYWQRILVKPQCYISLPKLPSHSKSILPLFIDCITFSYNLIFEFRHLFPKLEAAPALNWFNLIFNELLKYFTDPYLFDRLRRWCVDALTFKICMNEIFVTHLVPTKWCSKNDMILSYFSLSFCCCSHCCHWCVLQFRINVYFLKKEMWTNFYRLVVSSPSLSSYKQLLFIVMSSFL